MKCEGRTAMRCRTERDSASLRLHDPFDEVKSQSVTWDIRSDLLSAIKRFKQLRLICVVDAGSLIGNAKQNFFCRGVVPRCDFNVRSTAVLAVLEGIAQEILNALRKSSGVGLHSRKICIDSIRKFAMIEID